MNPPSSPANFWSLVSELFWLRVTNFSAAWNAGSSSFSPASFSASIEQWALDRSGREWLPYPQPPNHGFFGSLTVSPFGPFSPLGTHCSFFRNATARSSRSLYAGFFAAAIELTAIAVL